MSLVVDQFSKAMPGPHSSPAERFRARLGALSPEQKEAIHRLLSNAQKYCPRYHVRLAHPQKNQKVVFWDTRGNSFAGIFDGGRFSSQGDFWTTNEVTYWQERLVPIEGEIGYEQSND